MTRCRKAGLGHPTDEEDEVPMQVAMLLSFWHTSSPCGGSGYLVAPRGYPQAYLWLPKAYRRLGGGYPVERFSGAHIWDTP